MDALFPVDSQGRAGGDLFEPADPPAPAEGPAKNPRPGRRAAKDTSCPGDDIVVPGVEFIHFYDPAAATGKIRAFMLYWHDPGCGWLRKGTPAEGSEVRGQVFHADWREYARRSLERGRLLEWPSMTEYTLADLDAEEEAERTTVMVKGQHVRVGDDLWSGGKPHRVMKIIPYRHPVVTRGQDWRIARGADNWGMTLAYDHGWAASYEITIRPGEPPYENQIPDDDYLCPFYGLGAELHALFEAEGSPGSWAGWLAARGAPKPVYQSE